MRLLIIFAALAMLTACDKFYEPYLPGDGHPATNSAE